MPGGPASGQPEGTVGGVLAGPGFPGPRASLRVSTRTVGASRSSPRSALGGEGGGAPTRCRTTFRASHCAELGPAPGDRGRKIQSRTLVRFQTSATVSPKGRESCAHRPVALLLRAPDGPTERVGAGRLRLRGDAHTMHWKWAEGRMGEGGPGVGGSHHMIPQDRHVTLI